jgi:hypothetical protein
LTAFWGAFRLGELLGRSGYRFDGFSDLLWKDLKWGKDYVRITIKSAKVRGPPRNSALLFSIPDQKLCPVAALERLKNPKKTVPWETLTSQFSGNQMGNF